jgi:hypothetical protein
MCYFLIPVVAPLSGGAEPLVQLAKFGRAWISRHPDIDQEGYSKNAASATKQPVEGLVLEVVFYPMSSKEGVRHKIRVRSDDRGGSTETRSLPDKGGSTHFTRVVGLYYYAS